MSWLKYQPKNEWNNSIITIYCVSLYLDVIKHVEQTFARLLHCSSDKRVIKYGSPNRYLLYYNNNKLLFNKLMFISYFRQMSFIIIYVPVGEEKLWHAAYVRHTRKLCQNEKNEHSLIVFGPFLIWRSQSCLCRRRRHHLNCHRFYNYLFNTLDVCCKFYNRQ